MKIKLAKRGGSVWQADIADLPGSPPVGYGDTKLEALAELFSNVLHACTHGRTRWGYYVNFNKVEIVEEKV